MDGSLIKSDLWDRDPIIDSVIADTRRLIAEDSVRPVHRQDAWSVGRRDRRHGLAYWTAATVAAAAVVVMTAVTIALA